MDGIARRIRGRGHLGYRSGRGSGPGTAGRKRDTVLRVLLGQPLEIVAPEPAVTAADLSGWRDAFLERALQA
jgi:hypothetical protein